LITATKNCVYNSEDIIAYEIGGNSGLIKGDYKFTVNRGGSNDNSWLLHKTINS
jgi:arylsulfatase/uncharacterized sulfatase